ncbi:hypothetical protein CRUP_021080 [Coryphaenoides rupestris]|nr:hypothetical protein CRUP_021080 [Coryphaenoides rupestris]
MSSAEQTVTWLITLGVLESPKKSILDPEGFLHTSLRDGVVLCRLLERLSPGATEKVHQEPRTDGERLSNIKEFLRGSAAFRVETSLGRSSKLLQNQFRSLDMSENSGQQLLVKARFNFEQTNEDELSFTKGEVIGVTRQEDGGWWEGVLNGRTGWFPSNYVRDVKGCDKQVSPKSGTLKTPPKGLDTSAISKTYYNLVLQNILETETEYSKELQSLLTNYLRSLQSSDKLSSLDAALILGNLEEISTFQQMLVQSLEECTKLPESQQRVGGFFLNLMAQMKALYVGYCSNHPSAVNVLTQHSEALGEFMEARGAVTPGILTLTTGLSKPFMRLDKYPTLLKELERHMEEIHPDRLDIQKCMVTFKNLSAQCQELRKRKELELQILTDAIRLWEGDDIRTLGSVLHMSQALVHSPGAEEKCERYLLLFPHVLLLLSASPRMSAFIFQGKLPLTGMMVTKLDDCEADKNAFELSATQHPETLEPELPAARTPAAGPLRALCYKEDLSKSPKSVKKLLPKRKPERKQSEEEFAVRKTWQGTDLMHNHVLGDASRPSVVDSSPIGPRQEAGLPVIVPGDDKGEDPGRNGQTTLEEKSLVDVVYALRDEVQDLKQDNKKMKRSLEEEQRARKDLEKVVRRVLKSMNDPRVGRDQPLRLEVEVVEEEEEEEVEVEDLQIKLCVCVISMHKPNMDDYV